jgi:hypothetical protein
LKAPRHETPEDYKARTGKAWPDGWPVFFEMGKDTGEWYAEIYGRIKKERVLKIGRIYIFTEAGPPREGGKQHENQA